MAVSPANLVHPQATVWPAYCAEHQAELSGPLSRLRRGHVDMSGLETYIGMQKSLPGCCLRIVQTAKPEHCNSS